MKKIAVAVGMVGLVACFLTGCGGGGGSTAASAPTVTVSLSKDKTTVGNPVTVNWSSTNATSCLGSDGLSGALPASGNQTVNPTTGGQFKYTVTCTGTGGTAQANATLTVPIPVKATSYDNSKSMGLAPATMPTGVDQRLRTYARADFLQRGEMDLFIVETKYNVQTDTLAQAQTKPAQLSFYRVKSDGTYVKDNSVLTDTNVCIGPSKVYVADFNNDKIPDLFIACSGYDKTPFPGEKNWVVLSDNGKFTPKLVDSPVSFFHAAAAADLDGDGNVDVVTADPANGLLFFKNDGAGNFTVSALPVPVAMRNYFQVDLTDVNGDGKLDILAGGFEDNATAAPTVVMYGNGTANFSGSHTVTLPAVAGLGNVGDFLYVNGYMFVARTANGGVSDRGVQVVNMTNMHNCVPFSDTTGYQVDRLIPTNTGVVTENPYFQIPEQPFTPACAN